MSPPPEEGDDERAEGFRTYTRAIDSLDKAVDPALMEVLMRHERVSLIPHDPHLPQSWREVRTYLDPGLFYAGYLGVRGEIELPYQLRRDIGERVPQALLRDLFRIVFPDQPVERRPLEVGADPGGRKGVREAKEAQHREPIPVIESLIEALMAEQERQRRLYTEPWVTTLPDDAPREYKSFLYFADD